MAGGRLSAGKGCDAPGTLGGIYAAKRNYITMLAGHVKWHLHMGSNVTSRSPENKCTKMKHGQIRKLVVLVHVIKGRKNVCTCGIY